MMNTETMQHALEVALPYFDNGISDESPGITWLIRHALAGGTPLEIHLMTDQPPTCPKCSARVAIEIGAETDRQVVHCPQCNFRYRLEAQ